MTSYIETYLYDAMQILGNAMQCASEELNLSLDDFMHMFIVSGIAHQFEIGNPKYVAGKSGHEIAFDVYERIYGEYPQCDIRTFYTPPSPEYWVGWILAYYQWHTGKTFQAIQKVVSMEELLKKYHPLHEADERKTVDYIDAKFLKKNTINRLQEYRKRLGISQSELAAQSGVHLRSIQQYEIGAKDIKKASVTTVIALSKVLNCDTESLLN